MVLGGTRRREPVPHRRPMRAVADPTSRDRHTWWLATEVVTACARRGAALRDAAFLARHIAMAMLPPRALPPALIGTLGNRPCDVPPRSVDRCAGRATSRRARSPLLSGKPQRPALSYRDRARPPPRPRGARRPLPNHLVARGVLGGRCAQRASILTPPSPESRASHDSRRAQTAFDRGAAPCLAGTPRGTGRRPANVAATVAGAPRFGGENGAVHDRALPPPRLRQVAPGLDVFPHNTDRCPTPPKPVGRAFTTPERRPPGHSRSIGRLRPCESPAVCSTPDRPICSPPDQAMKL